MKIALTDNNKRKKIKVITFGVFDYFHYGHLKLLEQAKKYGDFLIVGVQIDSEISKRKEGFSLRYNYKQRAEMLSSLKIVDRVVPSISVESDISKYKFDVLAIGEDQNHDGFEYAIEWCKTHNKKVVKLKRYKGISSTQLKNERG